MKLISSLVRMSSIGGEFVGEGSEMGLMVSVMFDDISSFVRNRVDKVWLFFCDRLRVLVSKLEILVM